LKNFYVLILFLVLLLRKL